MALVAERAEVPEVDGREAEDRRATAATDLRIWGDLRRAACLLVHEPGALETGREFSTTSHQSPQNYVGAAALSNRISVFEVRNACQTC